MNDPSSALLPGDIPLIRSCLFDPITYFYPDDKLPTLLDCVQSYSFFQQVLIDEEPWWYETLRRKFQARDTNNKKRAQKQLQEYLEYLEVNNINMSNFEESIQQHETEIQNNQNQPNFIQLQNEKQKTQHHMETELTKLFNSPEFKQQLLETSPMYLSQLSLEQNEYRKITFKRVFRAFDRLCDFLEIYKYYQKCRDESLWNRFNPIACRSHVLQLQNCVDKRQVFLKQLENIEKVNSGFVGTFLYIEKLNSFEYKIIPQSQYEKENPLDFSEKISKKSGFIEHNVLVEENQDFDKPINPELERYYNLVLREKYPPVPYREIDFLSKPMLFL